MSISSELLTLQNTKTAIRTAINNKGGSVGASDTFASYATAIDNLPSGGSGNPLLTSIDVSDFSGTTFNKVASYITDVTIPSGVTSIGSQAFQYCSGLTSVTIPSGVTTIGQDSFSYCSGLTSVTIPDSVTLIDHRAFMDSHSPIKVVIGSGVTNIGQAAFQNITADGSITIKATTPPNINGRYDFWGSYPIYVPAASVDTYKAATNWSDYASRIFAIEDAITFTPTNGDPAISVKNYELTSANYVQSTDVPATIKNGAGALEICEGVDRIGISAFRNGSSLTSVTMPSTLTRIDELAFDGCSSLTSVTVNATTPPTLYAAAFGGSYPIYVPAESVDAYKAANNWSTYASRIEAIPAQEHALFDAPPQTATITEDQDEGTFVLAFPLKIYYSDGTEMTDTYHRSNGTVRTWSPQTELRGNIDDPNGDLADTEPDGNVFTPVYDSVNGWTMKYDVGFCLNDPSDPSPLVGKTVTFSTPPNVGMVLPTDYAEVDGAWVKVRDTEARSGSFTITMTGIDQTA